MYPSLWDIAAASSSELFYTGGKSKGTTCVVDRDVTAYMVVDRVVDLFPQGGIQLKRRIKIKD